MRSVLFRPIVLHLLKFPNTLPYAKKLYLKFWFQINGSKFHQQVVGGPNICRKHAIAYLIAK
jgi:hypothetical protein